MTKTIKLGKKEFTYKITYKLSYNFLKYRNKISNNIEPDKANQKAFQEIIKMQEKAKKLEEQGKTISDEELLTLSPEAIQILNEISKVNVDAFTNEEILDIVSNLTGIKEEEAILDLLDEEVEENGFDILVSKLISSINEVFMSAKGSSQLKEVNK